MKYDLDERARSDLRRVLGEMESLAPLAPDLERRARELQPSTSKTGRPFLVAFGAALAVFVLVLPVVLLSGEPIADEPGEVATPKPVDESTTTPFGEETAWATTDMPQLGTVLEHIGEGFIAVSSNEVWKSGDGIDWSQLGSLDQGAEVEEIVRSGSLLVAYGGIITDDSSGRTITPAVWASSDGGRTWDLGDLSGHVRDVTATPIGFVAA